MNFSTTNKILLCFAILLSIYVFSYYLLRHNKILFIGDGNTPTIYTVDKNSGTLFLPLIYIPFWPLALFEQRFLFHYLP